METKSASYRFAHRLLPSYIREDEDKLLESFLISENIAIAPNPFSVFMNIMFKSCCSPEEYKAAEEKNWEESVFEMTEEKFSEQVSLAIVKMPEPKEWAEAKYLLFAFAVGDEHSTYRNPMSDVCESRVRYFVFELGEDGGKTVYFVCEWAKDGSHINYGHLDDTSLESFANRVKKVLDKKWSWRAGVVPDSVVENIRMAAKLAHDSLQRGISCFENGDYAAAVEALTKAIELRGYIMEPRRDVNDYCWRGLAYFETGNYAAAVEDFTKAIEQRQEKNANDRYWRGFSYKMLGNNHAAMRDLNKALKIDPDFAEAKELLEEISASS